MGPREAFERQIDDTQESCKALEARLVGQIFAPVRRHLDLKRRMSNNLTFWTYQLAGKADLKAGIVQAAAPNESKCFMEARESSEGQPGSAEQNPSMI